MAYQPFFVKNIPDLILVEPHGSTAFACFIQAVGVFFVNSDDILVIPFKLS